MRSRCKCVFKKGKKCTLFQIHDSQCLFHEHQIQQSFKIIDYRNKYIFPHLRKGTTINICHLPFFMVGLCESSNTCSQRNSLPSQYDGRMLQITKLLKFLKHQAQLVSQFACHLLFYLLCKCPIQVSETGISPAGIWPAMCQQTKHQD